MQLNLLIVIKSVFNNNRNHYYSQVFFEKCWYKLAEQIQMLKYFTTDGSEGDKRLIILLHKLVG